MDQPLQVELLVQCPSLRAQHCVHGVLTVLINYLKKNSSVVKSLFLVYILFFKLES